MDSRYEKTILSALLLLVICGPLNASTAPRDLVLVLDNSGSMRNNDPEFLAGVAVRKFLSDLRGDTRVAIVVFDRDARLVMPLTPLDDSSRGAFLRSLDRVDYKGRFTDSAAAVERAIYELKMNGRPHADRFMVFMTDGIIDTGDRSSDLAKTVWLRNDLAAEAADLGIRVFGVAFTESADFLLIQSLSKRTSGEYFRAFSADEIDGVFQRIVDAIGSSRAEQASGISPPEETPLDLPLLELPAAPPLASEAPMALAEMPAEETRPFPLPQLDEAESAANSAIPDNEAAFSEAATFETAQSEPAHDGEAAGESAVTAAAAMGAAPHVEAEIQPVKPAAPPDDGYIRLSPAAAAATGGVIIALLGVVGALIRRNRAAAVQPTADDIPRALLNDLDGITDKPGYELGESLTVIGRVEGGDAGTVNYVVIPEPTIGRRHALIEFRNHCYWISDQSSLNGTFVNDRRIDGDTRLEHGDRIRVHHHEFEFLMLDMIESDLTTMSRAEFIGPAREADEDERTEILAPADPQYPTPAPRGE